MREPACRHCTHSAGCAPGGIPVLWCVLHKVIAKAPCRMFEREPGADDEL